MSDRPTEAGQETHHFLVYGRVQKVGYRNWAMSRAQEIGLTGWVRNRPDGRVEIMASGTARQCTTFETLLARGPKHADVRRVDARRAKPKIFQAFSRKATGPRTSEEISDIISTLDPEYLAACQKAYDGLPPDSRRMNRFPKKQGNWRFGQIDKAAETCGLNLVHLGPNAPPSLLCRAGDRTFGLDVTRPSWVLPLTEELSNNKFLTKVLLEGLNVPVPTGEICRTKEEARAAFARIDGAAVVKPVFGTEAKGVTLNINSEQACERAFAHAQAEGTKDLVLVEDYVRGVDLRLLLLGTTLIAAYLRLPAHVVGDGTQSISELVDEKNAARQSLPSTQESQLLKLGLRQRRLLSLQGYAPEDRPAPDQIVLLGVSPNYIEGADLLPITDQIHPDVVALARRAAEAIDPKGFWGVDILTEDFTKPQHEAKSVLCEVNSRPVGGVFRYATHGTHVHFFEEAFKTVMATPDVFRPGEAKPPLEVRTAPKPNIEDRFEQQVANVVTKMRPDVFPLTRDILVEREEKATSFYLLNPNSSFARGALAPWRWLALREELAREGVPVARILDAQDAKPLVRNNETPLGRAFLTLARSKMRTLWVEDAERLASLERDNPGWQISLETFETPSSFEVAILGGQASAAVRIDHDPHFATGKDTTEDLLAQAVLQRRGDIPLKPREFRRQLRDGQTIAPKDTPLAQPQAIARMAGTIQVHEVIPSDLRGICETLTKLLPGFAIGTAVFRLGRDAQWALSELRAGIDTRPFLRPDSGGALDFARLQAGYALANPVRYDVALSLDLLQQASGSA
ncbi:acylphosphatase [Shimia sp. FJ5]|uniref:acylphosphatase n=1 Tax=Shimia sp. FJ5 TaxID=3079054 RepID=UPI0026044C5B|nr:acylphosphatase [Shimia sp. FJ5]MDV4144309.1 acylphosphatase [Shimia sp. FJ5]